MTQFLSTAPYKGTRDFLPAEMSVRTQVFSKLYGVIESYGFERYDGPLLEPVELYEAKSGSELVNEQLFTLTDQGGRRLALRPEMTPSVARMIAANAPQLAFPARWYSHPNCHRYERPQKGRVREHWQINVDVFGSESLEAEVEIFELIHDMLGALGAKPSQYEIRANDRVLAHSALRTYARIPDELLGKVMRVLDRWEKYPRDVVLKQLGELGLDAASITACEELTTKDFAGICAVAAPEDVAKSRLATILNDGMTNAALRFDPLIVRGLDYYTSTVFEVFDTNPENRRSIFGGGRYDNLTALFSKQRIPGIGFGMGDVTLMDFLAGHGLAPEANAGAQVVVLPLSPSTRTPLKEAAARLRRAGLRVTTPHEETNLGKELKKADKCGAKVAVIIGEDELARGKLVVRDLRRSTQREVAREDITAAVLAVLEHVD